MKNSLVIILFDHPREHTADYSSQTSAYFSKHNVVVGVLLKDARSVKELFMQHGKFWFWKKQHTNLYLFTPLYILPFRRFRGIVTINIFLNILFLRFLLFFGAFSRHTNRAFLWTFNPEHAKIVKLFGPSFYTVYDCVDYHGEIGGEEKSLIRSSDRVFVNSETLLNIHRKIRKDITLVPLGFDVESFTRKTGTRVQPFPADKPVIGYVGGINSRLDFSLLHSVIRANPRYNFVFIGPIQKRESDDMFVRYVKPKIDTVLQFPNVHYRNFLPKNEVAQAIGFFSVCMIPYQASAAFNMYCFPMKVFEYFYAGKPVIATPIRELLRFPALIKRSDTPADWSRDLATLVSSPWPDSYKKQQRNIALDNTWDHKLSAIERVIESNHKL